MSLYRRIIIDMRVSKKVQDPRAEVLQTIVDNFKNKFHSKVEISDVEVVEFIKDRIQTIQNSIEGEITEQQKFELEVLEQYNQEIVTEEEIATWIKENINLSKHRGSRMRFVKEIMNHFGNTVNSHVVKKILLSM